MAPETSGRQLAALGAVLAVVVLVGWWWLAREPAGDAGAPPRIEVSDSEGPVAAGGGGARIVVHVAGAVRRPGVYRLRPGSRVVDAVRRAGGAARRAELSGLNLAAKVEDGRQVLVPVRAAPGAVPAAGPTGPTGPLNLNTATLEQLDTLDGVGPATAEKIVAYREANNGFSSVDELGEVPGIGAKRLAALRDLVGV